MLGDGWKCVRTACMSHLAGWMSNEQVTWKDLWEMSTVVSPFCGQRTGWNFSLNSPEETF